MNTELIHGFILDDLVERGLTPDDIEKAGADYLFSEFCEWNGLSGWSDTLSIVLDNLREAAK
jgi:hypothetical protein